MKRRLTRAVWLLVAGALLLSCHPAPSSHYLAATAELQNRIDAFRGELSSTRDIPRRLQELMEEEPSQPHAYVAAAQFLVFVGSPSGWFGRSATSPEAAESLLADAQRLDANYCPTYWVRAQFEVAMNRPDRALAAADAAATHHCDDPYLRVSRGRAWMAKVETDADDAAKKDIASAEAEFRQVIDAGPGATAHARAAYASAAYDYAKLLYRTGRHDELRRHLTRWEAAGLVFDPWAQINLAMMFDLIGDFDHAEIAAQSALTVFALPASRNAMGVALYGKAWSIEAAGGSNAPAAAEVTRRAQQFMPDASMAVKALTDAACCVSDAWRAVLERHAKEHESAPEALVKP